VACRALGGPRGCPRTARKRPRTDLVRGAAGGYASVHVAPARSVGVGGIVVGVGVAAAAAGFAGWSLSYRALVLPGSVLYAVAGLGVLVGLGVAAMSLTADLCRACGATIERGDAYFPLQMETNVVNSARALDFAYLRSLPMVPKNQMKMEVAGCYCPRCRDLVMVSVTQWKDYRPTTLLGDFEARGAQASTAIALLEAHEEYREGQES
jgi:hypothetical protein